MDLFAFENIVVVGLVLSWTATFVALVTMLNIKKQAKASNKLYEKIVNDLQVANSGAVGMGQRIIALEKKLGSGFEASSMAANVGEIDQQSTKTAKIKQKTRVVKTPLKTESIQVDKSKEIEKPFTESEPMVAIFSEKTSLKSKSIQAHSMQTSKPQQNDNPKREDPIDRAKHLLLEGVDHADVARRCGLSDSEAALMAMVLKNKNTKAAAQIAG